MKATHKITGNKFLDSSYSYHHYGIGERVKILREIGKYNGMKQYDCINEEGKEQTIYEKDLKPINSKVRRIS